MKPSFIVMRFALEFVTFFEKKTVRFFIVGLFGAIVEVLLFSGLVRVGFGILFGNFVAFHCAFALCFYLHYHYTYQRPYGGTRNVFNGFFKYAILMYAQLTVGSILILILSEKFDLMVEIAKVVQIGVVTPVGYAVQRLVIFRQREES
jgi:putative flippase GtrA